MNIINMKCFVLVLIHLISLSYGQSDEEWENFLDLCNYKPVRLRYSAQRNVDILNIDIMLDLITHHTLGTFTCIAINNSDRNYQQLSISFDGPANLRKVESNACRRYPNNQDQIEVFDVSKVSNVKIVVYSPFPTIFKLQSLKSITLNNEEQMRYNDIEELKDAQNILNRCQSHHETTESVANVCEVDDNFYINRIYVSHRFVWCIIQLEQSAAQFDVMLTSDNYKLYTNKPTLQVLPNPKRGMLIINPKNEQRLVFPRIVAIHQVNETSPATNITTVRFAFETVCKTPLLPKSLICGKQSNEQAEFTDVVRKGDYPWQVQIYTKNISWQRTCSGTIVNMNTVVTAGHCVHFSDGQIIPIDKMKLYLNEYNLLDSTTEHNSTYLTVKSIKIHSHYEQSYHEHDIAIIKLAEPLILSDKLWPICLTNNPEYLRPHVGVVTGFGLDTYGTQLTKLSQAQVKRIKSDTCRAKNNFFRIYLTESTFCAEYETDTQICPEEQGSPLYFKVNNYWLLGGLVTIGVSTTGKCANTELLLFTDVSQMYNFIDENL